jgi:hypothetical protein
LRKVLKEVYGEKVGIPNVIFYRFSVSVYKARLALLAKVGNVGSYFFYV